MLTISQAIHAFSVIAIGLATLCGLVSAWCVLMDGLCKDHTNKRAVCGFVCLVLAFIPYGGIVSICISIWYFKSEKIPKLPNINKGDLK